MRYGTQVTLEEPFGQAVARVRAALADQGFGVLTEIDVTATLKAKLGEQIEDYMILGACNPPFAYQALAVDRSIGMLLPCNVVVRAAAEGTLVEALDPQVMVTLTGTAGTQAGGRRGFPAAGGRARRTHAPDGQR